MLVFFKDSFKDFVVDSLKEFAKRVCANHPFRKRSPLAGSESEAVALFD
jgi:hypothetical protein